MRKPFLFLMMFIFCAILARGQTPFSGTSGNFITDSNLPLVEVLAPNGGETFNYLEPLQVTWTATDESFGTNPISIGISTEVGGVFTIVASNLPNTGTATVNPPGVVTNYAKVKVTGIDDFGIEGEDESDGYFTFDESFAGTSVSFITDSKLPLVEVLAPNGGETFNYLEPLQVTWTATDESFGANPISIGISTEVGGVFTIVAYNLPNTGTATVNPPGVVTNYAKVKVFGIDDFGIEGEDESDAYFTFDESFSGTSVSFITDSKLPVVTVNSPNGGESYPYLEPLQVTWTATDESFGANPISIGISTEVGGAYTIVAYNLPNTGTATVNPPGTATNYAKVKVIGTDDFGIEGEDESDGYFTFNNYFFGTSANFITDSKPPVITVITPNGGEAYYFADPLQVKWNATDDSFGATPVTISASTDGGVTYFDVANGLPNTDSAFVTAPQEITGLAMVKVFVQDEFGLTAYDESDAVFSLHGVYVDLTAFLQGPFTGAGMSTYLYMQSLLPTSQPYSAAPWNYSGIETADSIPNSNVVDWILIEIREAPDAASATGATKLAQRAGLILNNGTVTDVDGSGELQFGIEVTDNLFAIVHHRNHLPIMSAFPLTEAGGVYSFDYTTAVDKVYGGVLAHSQLFPGIWGMTGGDGNANGQIDNIDKNEVVLSKNEWVI